MGRNKLQKAGWDFWVLPMVMLIGVFVAASIISTLFFDDEYNVTLFFTAIGGVGVFVYYFKNKIVKWSKKK